MQNQTRGLAFLIGLFLVLAPCYALAQLNVALDVATFRYNSQNTYTELYYAIPVSELDFVTTESGSLQAQVLVQLSITKDGEKWAEKAWRLARSVTDSSQIRRGSQMVDVVHYLMQPGNYQISVYVEDLNNAQIARTVQRDLTIQAFSENTLQLSDIELASAIRKHAEASGDPFYKNGLEVIPEPARIFGQANPIVYFYLEAYNLSKGMEGGLYKTRCQITDLENQPVSSIKPQLHVKKMVGSSVEIGTVNIASLPSGVYNFLFEILDARDKLLQTTSKKLFIYNPGLTDTLKIASTPGQAAVANSEFAGMSAAQLDSDFVTAKYIVTQQEQELYNNLKEVEAKRAYLFEFWLRRDPTPATATNEFRMEYQRRLKYCDEHFGSYTRPGWKTDRGRVYILYGPPSEIERFPNNPLSYCYEIWHYDQIEGGVIFVFADLQEFGEYMQIHSTKRGEPMNEDWKNEIRKF
ncbi:MAG: GWxTD domain-containing protein [bacterium]